VTLLVLGEGALEGEPGDHAVEVTGLEGAEPGDQDTDGSNRQAGGKRVRPRLDGVVAQAPVDGSHRAPDRDPHQDREHDGQVGGGGPEVEAEAAIVEAAQSGPHQDHGREGSDVDQTSCLALRVTVETPQPPQAAMGRRSRWTRDLRGLSTASPFTSGGHRRCGARCVCHPRERTTGPPGSG
jgi:hypothetical protein